MSQLSRASWWNLYETWPLDRVEAFEQAMDRFEQRWRKDENPAIESVLAAVPLAERSAWIAELLAVEIAVRSDRGEALSLDEFLARFPADCEIVKSAWNEAGAGVVGPKTADSADFAAPPLTKGGRYLQPGEVLDERYEVEAFVGRGGMGELYRARRISNPFTFAVKVMHPSDRSASGGPMFKKRFAREMEILSHLHHRHLTAAVEYLELPGKPPIIVMDWIEGQNLADAIKACGVMPWREACEVARQAADGLGYALRTLGLVHRDIKPSNMILTPGGEIILLDFGMARATLAPKTESGDLSTSVGQGFGTPDFMAPEQWDDAHQVTAAADIYSLSCTLFFLLTGSPPARLRGPYSTETSAPRLATADVTTQRPDVPHELARLLGRMLDPDPSNRPQDGDELVGLLAPWSEKANLKSWAAGEQSRIVVRELGGDTKQQQTDAGERFWRRRTVWAWALAAAAALAVLGWIYRPLG